MVTNRSSISNWANPNLIPNASRTYSASSGDAVIMPLSSSGKEGKLSRVITSVCGSEVMVSAWFKVIPVIEKNTNIISSAIEK